MQRVVAPAVTMNFRVYQQLHNSVSSTWAVLLDASGSPHHATEWPATPVRTAMWHIASDGALAGAGLKLHRGGNLAVPARQARRIRAAVHLARMPEIPAGVMTGSDCWSSGTRGTSAGGAARSR